MSQPSSHTDVIDRFRRITQWSSGARRAPHKPLLLLLEIARLQRGEARLVSYTDVEARLQPLIETYAPSGTKAGAHYPFWRLRNDDGLWVVPDADRVSTTSSGDAHVTELRANDIAGGLAPEVWHELRDDPDLASAVAAVLLAGTFPESLHQEILDAVGMQWLPLTKTRREAAFRDDVLRAYEYRCAVCLYDGRLGRAELGLEAAHIRWCAYGGPNLVENGLALCAFHHRVFDRGALTLDDDHRIVIAQSVHGNESAHAWLIQFHGKQARAPQPGLAPPASQYVAWHRAEVFHHPARVGA